MQPTFAKSMGTLVGTIGTVLFYGTATMNLVWQHIGWQAVEKREFKRLYICRLGTSMDLAYRLFIHSYIDYV